MEDTEIRHVTFWKSIWLELKGVDTVCDFTS